MSGKFFLDTNIFVYAHLDQDLAKKQKALDLMRLAQIELAGVISYQVIQEFFNVVFAKSSRKMDGETARQFIANVFHPLLAVQSSVALFGEAIQIQERFRLSWYDSLIVAAAQQANCKILYTEDLQHNQRFGDVLVQNPFL